MLLDDPTQLTLILLDDPPPQLILMLLDDPTQLTLMLLDHPTQLTLILLDDPTQLILMLEVMDLVGIVSHLYGMLLHSAAPSCRDMAPCELSVRTLAITVSDCACRTTWRCSTSLSGQFSLQ
ncbi:hypothetical protein ACOMHN_058624 [Nucella lapillus]